VILLPIVRVARRIFPLLAFLLQHIYVLNRLEAMEAMQLTDPTPVPRDGPIGFQDLTAILDVQPTALAILDADATIVFVNRAWKNFVSLVGTRSTDSYVGRNYLEVLHELKGKLCSASILRLLIA
jgi:PAS domain-containing protein